MADPANLYQAYDQLTLKQPGILPSWATGALPHAALLAGAGALGGRYVLPKVLSYMYPGVDEERAAKLGTAAGAGLGLAAAAPYMYSTYTAGRDWTDSVSGGVANMLGSGWPLDKWTEGQKKVSFWLEPTVQPGQMSDTIRQALTSGQLDPTGALQMQRALQIQQDATPAAFGSALIKTLAAAGIGFGAAYGAARVGGALLGALGTLPPERQAGAGIRSGLLGAATNVVGSLF